MPTAGKLFGAVTYAILAWLISGLIPPLLPEGTQTGMLQPVNAAVGFVMGWTILGRNAGEGLVGTIGHASTTMVAVIFWCVVIWSGSEMIENSTNLRYDGPIEALQDMTTMAIESLRLIATPEIIGSMIIGIFVTALTTETAASRWA